jgi:cytochrome P450
MAEEAGDLTRRWRELSAGGNPIDLHAEMSRVTLRVVGRLLFGSDLERALAVVGDAFPVLGEYARRRAFAPLRVPHSWPTPSNRRALSARHAVYGVCDELIAERRASGGGGDDLLSLLVAARDGDERLDDAEIRDQILIFLLAGHDTTAIALTFGCTSSACTGTPSGGCATRSTPCSGIERRPRTMSSRAPTARWC